MSETPTEVTKVEEVVPETISQTYEASAIKWLDGLWVQLRDITEAHHLFVEAENESEMVIVREPLEVVREAVIRFAHYLDGFNTLTMSMELFALKQARLVDREFMQAMIEEIGIEKATEIAREINKRHGGILTRGEETPTENATEKPISG